MKNLKVLTKIAFRNVFRNKRRSFLTMGAVFVSVAAMTFANSYFAGVMDQMVQDIIRVSGHVQIQDKEYELKSRMMSLSATVDNYREKIRKLKNIENVNYAAPRITFGGMIDFENENVTSLAMGIDADAEKGVLKLDEGITAGKMFNPDKDETIIGVKLQEKLNLSVGDTITVITRTVLSSLSADNLVITGIADLYNSNMNNFLFIPIKKAEYLLDMDNSASTIHLNVEDENKINRTIKKIEELGIFSGNISIKKWDKIGILKDMMPLMDAMEFIFAVILGIIAAIGILNTMLMTVFERIREIGLIASLGLKRLQIMLVFLLEGFFISVMGGFAGVILGGMAGYYIEVQGITIGGIAERDMPVPFRETLYGDLTTEVILVSFIIGVSVAVIGALYPSFKASRMQPAKAMRST